MMMAYFVFPFPRLRIQLLSLTMLRCLFISFVENAGECMVLDNEASYDELIFKRMKLLISWSLVVLLFEYRLFSIL
ncbi:hypothetical protein HanRHA438_Chr01g0036351 [Helianthus annuus]|uniref:Uncharacterized protein n=1 Tax=Helianthus annuus TaxID=4232 RepID=A0A251VQM3_HELAN|nr:hypothetical protein HanXRQr2_Chr01g0035451 [Helianthus annuus]KAJ0627918.1 hypothetical protein HanHA89_Chr01g0031091 [Helianthus annuus]KAJ0949224.1 hypothetical protein HanRHA438_Chr01g0036351 [Helianthus annuus]